VTSRIKRVVVAGGDSIGWIAAAALAHSLRHLALEITVLDGGPRPGDPRARWTLPSQRGAHAQIGAAEPAFLRATGSTYRLGSEFVGWQGDGSRFIHAHGEIGSPIESTPFYKYLLARAIAGQPEKPEMYSVGGLAARAGRFARPMGADGELTADFTYGYHVDERRYAQYLRQIAEQAGVRRVAGQIADVDRLADGNIGALRLTDGGTLAGDLFIDCSGRDAQLISRLEGGAKVDWSGWLACDRMLSGATNAVTDPPSVTRIVAANAGWLFQVPLADSNRIGYVYSSAFANDDVAAAELQRAAGAIADPEPSAGRAAPRDRFWVNNCVVLGAGAAELEPLAGADLHFAQLGLAYLLELFPIDTHGHVEAAEYDRIMREYADALRDFTHAHYLLSKRPGEFWYAARTPAPPASLAAKLDLYSASGRIDIRDHEPFEELDWAWLLLGSGLVPRALEWQMARSLAALRTEQVVALRTQVERLAGSMPRHIDYLQRVKAAPASPIRS
jgi:tryptophan 7-halogenase